MKRFLKKILPKKITTLLSNLLFLIKFLLKKTIWFIISIFCPIKNNKIILMSFNGKGYGGNCKYITEELMRISCDLDIVWIVQDKYKDTIPAGVRTVRAYSIGAIKEFASSKIWVMNSRMEYGFYKKKKQIYYQLWHGACCLKKIENDAKNVLPWTYVFSARKDSKAINYLLNQSMFFSDKIKNTFWYKNFIINSMSPGDDLLLNKIESNNMKFKVKNSLKIDSNKGIILYAPTFRSNSKLYNGGIDLIAIRVELEKHFNKKMVILFRSHPNIDISNVSFEEGIINVSEYPDIIELISSSDIIISDYSSLILEGMLQYIPIFLFVPDCNEYDRGFYYDLQKLPFLIGDDCKKIEKAIASFNYNDYIRRIDDFINEIGFYINKNATKMIVDGMIEEAKICKSI